MKMLFSIVIAGLLFAASAFAEMKSLSEVMKRATPEEQQDLAKLLSDVSTVPAKDLPVDSTALIQSSAVCLSKF